MKELSLNILDITENSLKANSRLTKIEISETADFLTIMIIDNGCGMSKEMCRNVANPFCTTRTTRKVGLGVPFFKMGAESTGGSFYITSKHISQYPADSGTIVCAVFNKRHIDFTPLGDIVATLITLIQGHPDSEFLFTHIYGKSRVELSTAELREVLGDVPLCEFEVLNWIEDFLIEQYKSLI